MTVADSHLTALGTDVIVAVTMFLPDPDLARLFGVCRAFDAVGRGTTLWKVAVGCPSRPGVPLLIAATQVRSTSMYPALQSPSLVSVFRRDMDLDGLDSNRDASWATRYQRARRLQATGLQVSSSLLQWFTVPNEKDAPVPSPPSSPPGSPKPTTSNVLQRIVASILERSNLEGTNVAGPLVTVVDVVERRSRPDFLVAHPVVVTSLIPSSRRARQWSRAHSQNPVHKLSRLQMEHDDISFRADRPFLRPRPRLDEHGPGRRRRPALSYFECTVVRQPHAVGVGISDDDFRAGLPGIFVGWPSGGASFGYHGDDGFKFHNDGSGAAFACRFGPGDTVGCGVDWDRDAVFFTRNGDLVGTAFPNASLASSARWYPTVSLKHILSRHAGLDPEPGAAADDDDDDEWTDAVTVNCGAGAQRFVYDLDSYDPL
ncbi:B30.2/SPRY domain-containing protein [Plasmodiophora brassicae]|uniref:B30.2/SPRY domain-containing protein n=1 Tax=Plasmodiophora brassicae TaxID=37360 RepID=A0A0G4J0Q7_PLABS|nr:hypothetical protein PBRA_008256 [Plasmodiophora brassicae]